jgi:hypothetical protein
MEERVAYGSLIGEKFRLSQRPGSDQAHFLQKSKNEQHPLTKAIDGIATKGSHVAGMVTKDPNGTAMQTRAKYMTSTSGLVHAIRMELQVTEIQNQHNNQPILRKVVWNKVGQPVNKVEWDPHPRWTK